MKLPARIERHAAKFNAMSLRERVLVAAAMAAALIMIWTISIHDPMQARRRALELEIANIQESLASGSTSSEGASTEGSAAFALTEVSGLEARLAEINAKLESESAGLIPPERMVEVINDVLTRQHGVKLISLHNKPVTTLVQEPERDEAADRAAAQKDDGAADALANSGGPYMHPVEIVIEGSYLDILAYLRALEGLDWQFYWKNLDLISVDYPLNRVRIELGTLSMDKEWIGV